MSNQILPLLDSIFLPSLAIAGVSIVEAGGVELEIAFPDDFMLFLLRFGDLVDSLNNSNL